MKFLMNTRVLGKKLGAAVNIELSSKLQRQRRTTTTKSKNKNTLLDLEVHILTALLSF